MLTIYSLLPTPYSLLFTVRGAYYTTACEAGQSDGWDLGY